MIDSQRNVICWLSGRLPSCWCLTSDSFRLRCRVHAVPKTQTYLFKHGAQLFWKRKQGIVLLHKYSLWIQVTGVPFSLLPVLSGFLFWLFFFFFFLFSVFLFFKTTSVLWLDISLHFPVINTHLPWGNISLTGYKNVFSFKGAFRHEHCLWFVCFDTFKNPVAIYCLM